MCHEVGSETLCYIQTQTAANSWKTAGQTLRVCLTLGLLPSNCSLWFGFECSTLSQIPPHDALPGSLLNFKHKRGKKTPAPSSPELFLLPVGAVVVDLCSVEHFSPCQLGHRSTKKQDLCLDCHCLVGFVGLPRNFPSGHSKPMARETRYFPVMNPQSNQGIHYCFKP